METTAHLPDSGIRGHSAGAFFPWIIYAQETPHGLRWGVFKGAMGGEDDTGPAYPTSAGAYSAAAFLKERISKITARALGELAPRLVNVVEAREAFERACEAE